MAKRGSVTYQCVTALQSIVKFGHSKREAKFKGEGNKGLRSIKHMKNCLGDAVKFSKWCREEYGIDDIRQIDRSMYEEYLETRQEEVTKGTLGNIETSLRKLEEGITQQLKDEGAELELDFFSSGGRLSEGKNVAKDRSYSLEEKDSILSKMTGQERDAAELSYRSGTRLRETCTIKVKDIVITRRQCYIEFKGDPGTTKAARPRRIDMSKHRDWLKQLKEGRNPEERLFKDMTRDSLTKAYREACEESELELKGFHSTRHTYARENFEEYAKETAKELGIEPERILEMRDTIIDNIRAGERRDYGVEDRELYKSTIETMDRVMDQLGHGVNRTELYVVYLGR
ncbi:tyrosine-type recombinase/integrase [Ammoniphilus sp. CFH 90114]|uniref:tyrosine-type recombinase/integrase n=1 Tax=Ammoniphilus sp. CFH 90114 TaxID=2493665 RepID=UPI00100F6F56|nr:tyrosine-type recombinase/integrase [Ammoniphilus sp. CFH 90114]RXT00990.1 hypothetical protein EIZ39_25700 [Ammoniphilus sp. CFH 90114]